MEGWWCVEGLWGWWCGEVCGRAMGMMVWGGVWKGYGDGGVGRCVEGLWG